MRGRASLEVLALVAYVALLVGGVAGWLDLPITDDAGYWGAGQRLARGDTSEWRLDWSPLYVAAYAALERLPLAGHRMDWMHALCVLGSTLALWWALRARCAAPVALLLAGFWALLELPLHDTGRVYVFDMMLWSLAGGCFVRRRHLPALALMALAAIDRRETGMWLLALALIVVRWRNLLPRWQRWTFLAAALSVLALPPLLASGDRLWFAFSQHYALGAVKRGRADGDPWIRHEVIRRHAFPTAESIVAAARENPSELAAHVLHNLRVLPGAVADAFFKPLRPQRIARSVLLALLIGGLAISLLRRARGAGFGDLDDRLTIAFCSAAAAPLLVILLLYPRSGLLTPLASAPFLLIGTLLSVRREADGKRPTALVGAALLAFAWLVPEPPHSPAQLQWRRAAALLADFGSQHRGALLAVRAVRLSQLANRIDLEPVERRRHPPRRATGTGTPRCARHQCKCRPRQARGLRLPPSRRRSAVLALGARLTDHPSNSATVTSPSSGIANASSPLHCRTVA